MTRHRQAGLLSTELALLMPVLVVVALVSVHAVKVQSHEARARSAADAASRTAALHRSPSPSMEAAALSAAQRECAGPVAGLEIDWSAPDVASLRPGQVAVSLVCTEAYGGVTALFGADPRSVRSRSVSVIEYWRES